MDSIPERLTRVETQLETLTGAVTGMAGDMRLVRDHMLTTTAKAAGSWKTLSTIGGLIVGVGLVAGGVGAVAAVLLPLH